MADKRTSGRTGLFWRIPVNGLALAVLALSLFLFFSARWYLRRYGDVGFESVLYAIRFHASVAEKGQIRSFVHRAVLPALAVFLAVLVPLFAAPRGRRLRIGPVRVWPFSPWGRLFVAVLVSAPLVVSAARRFGAADWLRSRAEASTLYEKEYVDPASVRISFPERRRNLVCLYIESCETTFFSTAQGGALFGRDLLLLPGRDHELQRPPRVGGEAAGGLRAAVGVGEIGLDVEDRRAVHQVGPGDEQRRALALELLRAQQPHAAQPQGVGAEGRARGEDPHAHIPAEPRRAYRGRPALPVGRGKMPDQPEV